MQRTATQYGGISAVIGGVLCAGALIAEPTFDGDLPAQLHDLAASTTAVVTGLLGLVGLLLVVVGALGVVASLAGSPAGQPYAAFARPLVMIGGTVALLDVGIDLSAYREMADVYANAAPGDVQAALYSAYAVGAVLSALYALWAVILAGVVPILLGLAIYRTRIYPRWVAAPAVLGGLIGVVLGVIGLLPLYDLDLGIVDLAGHLLAVSAIVVAGAMLWIRRGGLADGTGDAVTDGSP